jgi:hypothetical protein
MTDANHSIDCRVESLIGVISGFAMVFSQKEAHVVNSKIPDK